MKNMFTRLIRKNDTLSVAREKAHVKFPRTLSPMENDYLNDKFGNHPTRPEDAERVVRIKNAAREFTKVLMENGAPTPELQEAIDQVRTAAHWGCDSVRSGRLIEERRAIALARQMEAEQQQRGSNGGKS
jgi:hypothetical protein